MIIKDVKKQALLENYSDVLETSFVNYIISESESDPGFFRWLFDDEFLEDFDCGDKKEAFGSLLKWADSLGNVD